jgi:hypothetical protein
MLRGEKAPDAVEPAKENEHVLQEFILSIRPRPDDWETRPENLITGSRCQIDYRSLIHRRVEPTYRGYIPRRANFDYDQFFAATDTLLDVQNILHIAECEIWPESQSVGQLWMYGAMQALAVQQGAAKQLLVCFGLQFHPDAIEALKEINELRVSAVGHPQSHIHKNLETKGCTYLAHRAHGSKSRFNIATLVNFRKFKHRTLDIPELVGKQAIAIELCLSQIWKIIKADPSYDHP